MRRQHWRAFVTSACLFTMVVAPAALSAEPVGDELAVNQAASSVGFTVFTRVVFKLKREGRFKDFVGAINYDPVHPADTRVDLTVFTSSVDTTHPDENAVLRSSDFFDVDRFPTMRFVSSSAVVRPDGQLDVSGELTIRGITQRMVVPVRIAASPGGTAAAPRFETQFDIDRETFGLVGTPAWSGFKVSIARNVQIHLAIATSAAAPRLVK